MKKDAVKLELMRWVIEMEDKALLQILLNYKRSWESDDWFGTLSPEQQAQVQEGIRDYKAGRTVKSADVRKKYGKS